MTLVGREYNPISGVTTEYWSETTPEGKQLMHIRSFADIAPQFEQNRKELNVQSSKVRKIAPEGLGKKHASIPMALVEHLRAEKGLDILTCSEADMKKFLNSTEYSKVRTSHGRV